MANSPSMDLAQANFHKHSLRKQHKEAVWGFLVAFLMNIL